MEVRRLAAVQCCGYNHNAGDAICREQDTLVLLRVGGRGGEGDTTSARQLEHSSKATSTCGNMLRVSFVLHVLRNTREELFPHSPRANGVRQRLIHVRGALCWARRSGWRFWCSDSVADRMALIIRSHSFLLSNEIVIAIFGLTFLQCSQFVS